MTAPDSEVAPNVAAARLWAASKQPYLSSALFALTVVSSPGLGTFAVDRYWRLYADPSCFLHWSVEEAGAVLVHEVHHLLREHAGRAVALGVGLAERYRFNVAADMEINDDLKALPLPAGGVLPENGSMSDGELAETYYAGMAGDTPPGLGWGDCGSGAHGVRGAHEHDEPGLDDLPGVDAEESELIRAQVALDVRAALRAGVAIPPGLERWADKLLSPRVDWRRLLAGLVRSGLSVTAGRVDFSYRKPSRRQGAPAYGNIVIPALVAPVPDVAVVVDTSGSMNATALGQSLAEVAALLRSSGVANTQVRVLSCDAAVHLSQQVFSVADIRLYGGGGTDMGVGIAAVAALRPRPALAIVLTDGLTPWPEQGPVGVGVIVGLLGDGPDAPSWARAVRIPMSA